MSNFDGSSHNSSLKCITRMAIPNIVLLQKVRSPVWDEKDNFELVEHPYISALCCMKPRTSVNLAFQKQRAYEILVFTNGAYTK